ncbi:MAG: peptidoglycan-binding protein [Rhodobacteraceae bacterium]|nr:peptidoglycan-binding protein [Paracoccaceae bacterium]
MIPHPLTGLAKALMPVALLVACSDLPAPQAARPIEVDRVYRAGVDGAPDAAADTCWGEDVTPAVIETVTRQVAVPPKAGAPQGGVVYQTETHQRIVRERQAIWFRTPCPETMTPAFVASLQRALAVRGYYSGEASGRIDRPTRLAVRAFQKPLGLNSGLLSLNAAQQLGIAAYERGDL